MSQITKNMWLKLKSSFQCTDGSSRKSVNSVGNKLNVNEEYMQAFRTKSFIEIWSKVQRQQKGRTSQGQARLSSLCSFPSYTDLSDYLLEPRQEILISMIENSNLHHLLVDYFEGSLEACKICGFILQSIDQTRSNYCMIQRVIKLIKRVPDNGDYTEDQCRIICTELASFAKLDNPLSGISPAQFSLIHDKYGLMLDQLTLTRRKLTKKAKLKGLYKKAVELSLVMACGTLAVATLVLALHSMVGVVVSPGLVSFSLPFLKKIKVSHGGVKTSMLVTVGAQLDAAAKGVYILNRDFDTMSRLVMRLHDEIEHEKAIAKMCMRNQRRQMLKEAVREFQTHESCFLEQLGELEEHVYLCFLTINRARRLVIQEIMVQQQQHT